MYTGQLFQVFTGDSLNVGSEHFESAVPEDLPGTHVIFTFVGGKSNGKKNENHGW